MGRDYVGKGARREGVWIGCGGWVGNCHPQCGVGEFLSRWVNQSQGIGK